MDEPIERLRDRAKVLFNQELPQLAAARQWPIRFNHCFMRVVYDQLCQGCWYDNFDRGKRSLPVIRQLNHTQLQQVIAICEAYISGQRCLKSDNQASLEWRKAIK